ncbi:RloB family protein [Streptomyces sp. NBC_01429]|uniref:RloB family protein n=1 Tax=Streptomyces sp. NBC_01429 TaxID=2903862 RepID=UPI002E27DB57|nr:RloB family protein [Streptomyces sp. NBC_01429]
MARSFPREGSGRRRGPVRRSARTMLIVCGSKETERQYLQGLRDHLRNPAVSVVVRGKACSPTQLVAYARGQRDLNPGGYDEVWCVFDVDDYIDVADAALAARRQGIRIAVSNPCFELWLLLHFTDHRAHIGTKKLLPLMEKHVPGYDKTRIDFRKYRDEMVRAAERAQGLEPTGEEHGRNPSTGVWRLTDRMANP